MKGARNKGPKISYMFYFFITFTTVCQGLPVLWSSGPSVTEGLKHHGFALWFSITTNELSYAGKLHNIFPLKLKYRHISKG